MMQFFKLQVGWIVKPSLFAAYLATVLGLQRLHKVNWYYTIAQSKLVLYDAIFLATCVAMALRDKLQVDCSVHNLPLQLFSQLFWVCNDCTLLHRVS